VHVASHLRGRYPFTGVGFRADQECWQYDDADSPTAIVLSDPLCARITEEGFTSIHILAGCGDPVTA
jgi:hypothetical protein